MKVGVGNLTLSTFCPSMNSTTGPTKNSQAKSDASSKLKKSSACGKLGKVCSTYVRNIRKFIRETTRPKMSEFKPILRIHVAGVHVLTDHTGSRHTVWMPQLFQLRERFDEYESYI
ncbi:unnamed protein product [Medioppia subpectinata]|uniref:Uncharacterized protein n=1 Tax=Medioppia subpectinata TaxID=1979941 RepID=A0A7R9PW57_9ACAR|nr:unnamed protein product [Medioppia subpectinata]CAG2103408.1 unnamed protein product [Medioppia subpectinata]